MAMLPIWGFLRSSGNTNPIAKEQMLSIPVSPVKYKSPRTDPPCARAVQNPQSNINWFFLKICDLWPPYSDLQNWAWHTWHTQEFVQCMRFLFPLFLTRSNWWHTCDTRNPFLQHLSIPKVTLHQLSRLSIAENSWYLKSWKFIWLNIMAIASDLI